MKGPRAAAAGDLYISPLFRGRRHYVERSCDRWFILSAKHGLVDPAQPLAPYEETLKGKTRAEKRAWTERILEALDRRVIDYSSTVFEVHAGAEYRDFGLTDGLRARGAAVEVPALGLSQGQQLAFYGGTHA